jgi:cytochrome c-type biogenesis protein CcmH
MRNAFYVLRFTNLLLLAVLLCSGVAFAQEPGQEVSDDDVNRVSRQLYCPICENIPLDACTTQACDDWRELIREKLAAGESDAEIVAYFADVYGERVRATPTTSDLSLAVWILPLLGGVVGGGYMVVLLRRWLAQGAAPESAPVPPAPGDAEAEDDYRARLEREIRERG